MLKLFAGTKKIVWVLALVLPLLALLGVASARATSTLSGRVYIDYNSDGFFNATSTITRPAVDQGVSGVQVRVFDRAGNNVTPGGVQVTDANGAYSFTTVATDTTTGPYRVEFTPPVNYQPGPVGIDNASSVRFVSGTTSSNLDLGLVKPNTYCQANPRLITSCYVYDDAVTGPNSASTVIVSQPYDGNTNDGTDEQMESLSYQVGTTWGLAYQRSTRTLFAAAYVKRGADLGPGTGDPLSDGSGTIYRLTPDGTPDGTPYVDLDVYFNDANLTGSNLHSSLMPVSGDFDQAAYAQVGKSSLGDLDIGEDDKTLWVINLTDRKLYRIQNVDPNTPPTAGDGNITRYGPPAPSPACATGGVFRPFGLKPHNGKIYVGGVCTEEGSTSTTATAELRAIVFAFDPVAATFTQVLDFPLNYSRGCADRYGYPALATPCRASITDASYADWRPYTSTVPASFPAGFAFGYTAYPQPMLTDIEFDGNDMIIGLRDRFSDQVGYNDPGPTNDTSGWGSSELVATPAGDILRACWNGTTWNLESNGTCGAITSSGAGNEQGPSNGEYYYGESINDAAAQTGHDELSLGGLAQVPGYPEVALTVSDPFGAFQAGTMQLFNQGATAGSQERRYQIYATTSTTPTTFAKANGLGDLEALCDAAPLEIGNRIWWDPSPDGVQAPDETGMDGLAVELWLDPDGNTQNDQASNGDEVLVATTATANGGQYYFSFEGDSAKDNANGLAHQVWQNGYTRVLPNQHYQVRVPNWSSVVQTWAVTNGKITSGNPVYITKKYNGGAFDGVLRDSNAYADSSAAAAAITTGGAGANNHTFDLGFSSQEPTALTLAGLRAQTGDNNLWGVLMPIGLLALTAVGVIAVFSLRRPH